MGVVEPLSQHMVPSGYTDFVKPLHTNNALQAGAWKGARELEVSIIPSKQGARNGATPGFPSTS